MFFGWFRCPAKLNAVAFFSLATGAFSIAAPTGAWAISSGCAQFNGSFAVDGGGNISRSGNGDVSATFQKGDILSFSIVNGGGVIGQIDGSAGTVQSSTSASIVVSADLPVGVVRFGFNRRLPNGGSATWTCTPAGPTNSQILEQTRQTYSKLAAQTSSQAMGDATSGAISDAFSGGGTTQFSQGGFSTSFAALEKADQFDTNSKKSDPFDALALGYAKAP